MMMLSFQFGNVNWHKIYFLSRSKCISQFWKSVTFGSALAGTLAAWDYDNSSYESRSKAAKQRSKDRSSRKTQRSLREALGLKWKDTAETRISKENTLYSIGQTAALLTGNKAFKALEPCWESEKWRNQMNTNTEGKNSQSWLTIRIFIQNKTPGSISKRVCFIRA